MNRLYYWHGHRNFGDELSLYLVEKISGKEFGYAPPPFETKTISAIGSILTYKNLSTNLIVWGSGALKEDSLKPKPLKLFPITRLFRTIPEFFHRKKAPQPDIRAVRGPWTKAAFDNIGLDCPDLFGDPAILTPLFYAPKNLDKKFEVGLILHHIQASPLGYAELASLGIRLIDIRRETPEEIESFIDEVCSCQIICSASLHGIIVAQAYDIPAQWIQIEGQPIRGNNSYKFEDYFLGAGQVSQAPVRVKLSLEDMDRLCYLQPPEIRPFVHKQELLSAFPYDVLV